MVSLRFNLGCCGCRIVCQAQELRLVYYAVKLNLFVLSSSPSFSMQLNCHWSFLMGRRHPNSKKWLRSLCKVREFILDSSHTGKSIG
ncbi:hypothetical protein HanRHA438_Chr16g0768861 [Helianthus annuus]|nr:hypothetical protein HanRHA438_Chr16g0768861 [Helianthus annuus]